MKGYSKINENNPFFQRSKSKKEYPFLDQDFDRLSAKHITKKSQDDDIIIKNDDLLSEKCHELYHDKDQDHQQQEHEKQVRKNGGGVKVGAVLRRNFSVSSSTTAYQKDMHSTTKGDIWSIPTRIQTKPDGENQRNKGDSILERQSSTRAIQETIKRAFSMRSSSVNNTDRYCRIYDQPVNVEDCDNYDYAHHNNDNGVHDDQQDNNGSMETRSMSKSKKLHVGSKVVKACKRLFTR